MMGIVGASGLIGYNLYNFLKKKGEDILGTYFSKEKKGLIKFDLKENNFSLFDKCKHVIIAGAITNLDECFLKKEEAYKINVERTIEFVKYLTNKKVKSIFLSSDQVFDGGKGNYTEKNEPNPINYYGEFKFKVEKFLRENSEDYLILRLSKTYSKNLENGGMFADIFLRLKEGKIIKIAYNQIFNPTEVEIVCNGILKGIKMNLKGLYHLAEDKIMSRYEFALNLAEEYRFDKKLIEPVDFNTLNLIEKRALNSSLNTQKWQTILEPLKN